MAESARGCRNCRPVVPLQLIVLHDKAVAGESKHLVKIMNQEKSALHKRRKIH